MPKKYEKMGPFYKFTCFAHANLKKLLKPAYATLRESGHLSFSYPDDSYLQGDDDDPGKNTET